MTYIPFRYVSFKALKEEHLPLINAWLLEDPKKLNQNSLVALEVLKHGQKLLLEGLIDLEGQHKPIKPFVIYDNETPCGYIHYYQTTQTPGEGAAMACFFKEPLSDDKGKEAVFLELFLDNYLYPEYSFCIVDIEPTNQPFIDLFTEVGFSLHTHMDDFLILIKQGSSSEGSS